MSLVNFKAQNHPQQTGKRGPRPEVDNLATPPEVFDPLNERFRFTLDACALPHNTKLERYFAPPGATGLGGGARGIDGLAQSWAGERVWCNPPYSNIEPWVEKATGESLIVFEGAALVVMLVPANRCEQGWWQRHIEPYRDGRPGGGPRVEFLPGRLRFIKHGHDRVEPNQRPPFGCALLIWGGR